MHFELGFPNTINSDLVGDIPTFERQIAGELPKRFDRYVKAIRSADLNHLARS